MKSSIPVLFVLLSACADAGNLADSDGLESIQSALTETGDFSDWSGRVKIKLFYNMYGPEQHVTGTSSVTSDYVLVGGAAWVENAEMGALLTEGRPDNELTTWHASSKDHIYPDSHTLHVVAIGMKLDGVTASVLRSYMQVFQASYGTSSLPNTSITVPSGYTLIGGGSRVDYYGYGNVLTKSYPVGSTWYSQSKDHRFYDPATITAYAIGIQNVLIPGFGYLEATQSSSTTYTSTGNGFATASSPGGYVITCPGGQATWTSAGRLLWGLKMNIYNPYNMTIATKDQQYKDGGYTTAYTISVRLKP